MKVIVSEEGSVDLRMISSDVKIMLSVDVKMMRKDGEGEDNGERDKGELI